ncbi:MAG: hypothetical protein ABIJ16_14505 [Bacteroidota bacterium]
MTKGSFKNVLSKSLFWDIDFSLLDVDKQKRLVIQRIVTRGNWEQFMAMVHYYGEDKLKAEVVNLKGLSDKNINFLHIIWGIPKREFKCYTKTQLQKNF